MKSFCGNGFATRKRVAPCSGSASTATADNAIAAVLAVTTRGSGSAVAPTGGIKAARKAGSIIATGNEPTGIGTRRGP